MDYVGSIYRPPSEADSLLLQVTVGCSHNRCAFCAMYLDKRFQPKPWEQVETDIREAAGLGPTFRRVFLCDGDALILSTARLVQILEAILEYLPFCPRVTDAEPAKNGKQGVLVSIEGGARSRKR